ncbi:hypothetical protein LXL04_030576 [Taraxacum kok-saghyz]
MITSKLPIVMGIKLTSISVVDEKRTRHTSGIRNGFLCSHGKHPASSCSCCLRAVPFEVASVTTFITGPAGACVVGRSGSCRCSFAVSGSVPLLLTSRTVEFSACTGVVEVAFVALGEVSPVLFLWWRVVGRSCGIGSNSVLSLGWCQSINHHAGFARCCGKYIPHSLGSLTATRGTCIPTCRSSESNASGPVYDMVVMPHCSASGWPGLRVANGKFRGRLGEMGNFVGGLPVAVVVVVVVVVAVPGFPFMLIPAGFSFWGHHPLTNRLISQANSKVLGAFERQRVRGSDRVLYLGIQAPDEPLDFP